MTSNLSSQAVRGMKKIFIVVWSLWAATTFALGLLVVFPILAVPVLLGSERLKRTAVLSLHWFSRALLALWCIKLTVVNKHASENQQQVVYVPNHRSYLDAIISHAVIPGYVKYLGKAEILDWWLLGYIVKHYHVAVKRNNADSRAQSVEALHQIAASGASIGIFPEGTCNTTRELLKPFFDGAFKVAIANRLPMVPLTYIGTGELMPRNALWLRPGKVIVYWHQAIATDGLNESDIPELKEKVRAIMLNYLKKHYPNGYEE